MPGLGEVRRRTLLKHFGSLKKLREADAEQIAQVPGIGVRTAESIKAAVSGGAGEGAQASGGPTVVSVNTATGEIEEE